MTEIQNATEPLIQWDVPGIDKGAVIPLAVGAGQTLVVVGANGTGKSALGHWLNTHLDNQQVPVIRVLAHRRLWMTSAGTNMTTQQHQQQSQNFKAWDSDPSSRTRIEADDQRSSKVLYDLLARANARDRQVAALYDAKQYEQPVEEPPIATIGRMFAAADLDFSFSISPHETFEAVRTSGVSYPVSEMSDGEKGAFLLAAEVLLSPQSGVVIIDEPERHLNRAISADFITALISERSDCGFVLLTHDLELVARLEPSTSTVCIASSVGWDQGKAVGWELTVDPGTSDIPDSARQAILGGRRQLLFVEGQMSSLDYPLYRLLFPDWTVVPCGGSDEVVRAVAGLNGTDSYHWVDGRGVLDGDARTAAEVTAMVTKKILVLPVNEVENLYFLADILDAIADQQAALLGKDASALRANARAAGLGALMQDSIQHLASANAEKILRRQALASLPNRQQLVAGGATLPVNLASPYPDELKSLNDLVSAHDYDGVMHRFSVRDSGFPNAVAKALGFSNRQDYESAVRVRLERDPALLTRLRDTVGSLP